MSDDDELVDVGDDTLAGTGRPRALGDLVRGAVERRGWSERVAAASIYGRWEEVVGPELAGRCEPARLVGGRLLVRAESQAWATQVTYLLPMIVQRAQEVLGGDLVREAQVVVGPLQGLAGGRRET